MSNTQTEKQKAYMENAMRAINLIGYKSPENVKISEVEVKNEKDTWSIKQWDEYFKSRK